MTTPTEHSKDVLNHLKLLIAERERTIAQGEQPGYPQEIGRLIHQLSELRNGAARDYFLELLTGKHVLDDEVLLHLIEGLGFHWTDFVAPVPLYEALLKDCTRDEQLRATCAAVLGSSMESQSSIPALVEVVGRADDSDYVREAAMHALVRIGGLDPIPVEIQRVLSPDDYSLFATVSSYKDLRRLVRQVRERYKGDLPISFRRE